MAWRCTRWRGTPAGPAPRPIRRTSKGSSATSRGEWPEFERITDPATLDRELEPVRFDYNTVRLHAAIGYVTPDDEHHGRGAILRKQRAEELPAARAARLAHCGQQQNDN